MTGRKIKPVTTTKVRNTEEGNLNRNNELILDILGYLFKY